MVLIVALILLLVMTILGISGVQVVTLEERMTANAFDRSLAFQAAESALREGEAAAVAQSAAGNTGFPNGGQYTDADDACGTSTCTNGFCAIPDKDCTPRWDDTAFTGWANTTLSLGTLTGAPQYFIEYLRSEQSERLYNPESYVNAETQMLYVYRVTARNAVATGRANVMVQSVYKAD